MIDLVDRLRNSDGYKTVRNFSSEPGYEIAIVADTDLMREAADEIERLRDGIARHKQDVPNTPSYLSLEADRRLWALIEEENTDG